MDKCVNRFGSEGCGIAATAPLGDALAPPVGPAKPALDLSLGHFRTSGDVCELDVVTFSPYVVTLDYSAMSCEVVRDPEISASRQDRRAGLRKVQRLVAVARKSGMSVVEKGAL